MESSMINFGVEAKIEHIFWDLSSKKNHEQTLSLAI